MNNINTLRNHVLFMRILLSVLMTVLLGAAAIASPAPSPYVGKMGPEMLGKIASAQSRSHEVYNRQEMISPYTLEPLASKAKANAATNSLNVSSSVQTLDYLTDLAPGFTAPGSSPTNIDPVYSPSENYVVFASNGVVATPASGPKTFTPGSSFHLWAMQAGDSATLDSATSLSVVPSSLVQLTNGKTSGGTAENERWPLVISDTQLVFCQQQADGFYHVILGTITNTDGVLSVTNESDVTSGLTQELDCEHPSYSGGFIVFAGRVNSSSPYHIYQYDLADKSTTQLTSGSTDEENPTYSPLGGLIAFDSNASAYNFTGVNPAIVGTLGSGPRNIFVSNTAGTNFVQVTQIGGSINSIEPAWGVIPVSVPRRGLALQQIIPQGQKLFFSSNRINGHYNICYLAAPVQSSGSPVPKESISNPVVFLKTSDPTGAGGPQGSADNFEPAAPGFNFYYTIIYSSPRFVQNLATDNPLDNGINPQLVPAADREPAIPATSPLGSFNPADTEQAPTGGFEVLGSKLFNIDPPTLLSYSPAEIIHTQSDLTLGTPTFSNAASRFIAAGSVVHFVVRLSQRQSGVGQVYLQIKNPNSKFQDAAGLEHKVFTQDPSAVGPFNPTGVPGGAAPTINAPFNTLHTASNEATTLGARETSGTDGESIGGYEAADGGEDPIMLGHMLTSTVRNSPNVIDLTGTYPTGGVPGQAEMSAVAQAPVTSISLADVQNLDDFGGDNHLAGDILQLYSAGGAPMEKVQVVEGNYNAAATAPIAGTFVVTPVQSQYTVPNGSTLTHPGYATVVATSRMDFFGNEVDCQAVNTNLGNSVDMTLASSFSIPVYTPGIADADLQSGNGLAPGDAGYLQGTANNTVPVVPGNIWLKLNPVPASETLLYDQKGGVLYETTWTTPQVPSDFYLDVVAYDNEALADGSRAQNWRIYDNVWGFTTSVFQTTTSPGGILVVNDYDLPQKFFAGKFGNISPSNIPLNYFGAESYLTDIDVDYNDSSGGATGPPPAWLPDSAYTTDALDDVPGTMNLHGRMTSLFHLPAGGSAAAFNGTQYVPFYANTLGVNAYVDPDQTNVNIQAYGPVKFPMTYFDTNTLANLTYLNNAGTATNGFESTGFSSLAPSNHYDIWRILSRGPLPQSVLNAYSPQSISQPLDPINGNTKKNVLVANSCVIWSSPFAGDEFAGSGTITDPNTQAELTSYVNGGGRLYVEGIDVGYALTSNGTTKNPFYSNILGATFGTDAVPIDDTSVILTGAVGQTHSISEDSYINAQGLINYPAQTGSIAHDNFKLLNTGTQVGTIPDWNYGPPEAGTLTIAFDDRSIVSSKDSRTDASLNDGGVNLTGGNIGSIDGFTADGTQASVSGPLSGAFSSVELSGSASSDHLIYTTFASPSGVSYGGGTTVYSSFGLESLSQETQLAVRADNGFQGTKTEYDLFANEEQRTDVMQNIVSFLRTGTITGVVTNTNGGVFVPHATVVATWVPVAGFGNTTNAISFTGVTNASGVYTITGVPTGRYNLAAYFPGTSFQHAAGSQVNVLGGDIGTLALQVTPAASGSLQVIVKDAVTGLAIANASVDAIEATGAGSDLGTQTTDPTGTANYTNVPSGSYNVTATDTGYAPNTVLTKVSPGQQDVITILLIAAPGTISGKVTALVGGAAISGATVSASLTNGTGTATTTTTASDGTYTLTVTPGSYTVSVTDPNYSPSTPQSPVVVVSNTPTTGINFTLNNSPVITGTVTDVNSNPISSASVAISPSAGLTTPVSTNSSGVYTINGVTGGTTYTLTVTASGYNTASTTVTPASTGATTVNFSLSKLVVTGFVGNVNAPVLISLPYDYNATAYTLSQIFGYSNPKLAVWDPSNLIYDVTPTPPANTMLPGIGYWVRFPVTPVVASGNIVPKGKTVQLGLGWNQIGDPYLTPEAVSTLKFTNATTSSTGVSFATAVGSGLINSTLYSYNPTTNAYVPLTAAGSLQPFVGYWIQVYSPFTLTYP